MKENGAVHRSILTTFLILAWASPVHAECLPTLTLSPVEYTAERVVVEVSVQTCDAAFAAFGVDLRVSDVGSAGLQAFDPIGVDVAGTLAADWTMVDTACQTTTASGCDLIRVGGFDGEGLTPNASGLLCRLVLSGAEVGDGRLAVEVVRLFDDVEGMQVVTVSGDAGIVSAEESSWGMLKARVR